MSNTAGCSCFSETPSVACKVCPKLWRYREGKVSDNSKVCSSTAYSPKQITKVQQSGITQAAMVNSSTSTCLWFHWQSERFHQQSQFQLREGDQWSCHTFLSGNPHLPTYQAKKKHHAELVTAVTESHHHIIFQLYLQQTNNNSQLTNQHWKAKGMELQKRKNDSKIPPPKVNPLTPVSGLCPATTARPCFAVQASILPSLHPPPTRTTNPNELKLLQPKVATTLSQKTTKHAKKTKTKTKTKTKNKQTNKQTNKQQQHRIGSYLSWSQDLLQHCPSVEDQWLRRRLQKHIASVFLQPQ